jgi:SAM-dependent methyltransferase
MPDETSRHDRWSGGSAYEPYVGRWSKLVAEEFVEWLGIARHASWLDVGCGTAALTRRILALADPAAVLAVDQSLDFVLFARDQLADDRAGFAGGDATALPIADNAFHAAVSGLVLNFVPEPSRMVAEMARVTREGGTVAVYVWDYAGEMQMMRQFWDAAVELDPAASDLDEGARFSVCSPDQLRALFESAGLRFVETRAIDVATPFRDFDDYWTPFLGGTGAAPGYVASLTEDHRAAMRERLRESLPTSADGSISLIARALAVRGAV